MRAAFQVFRFVSQFSFTIPFDVDDREMHSGLIMYTCVASALERFNFERYVEVDVERKDYKCCLYT